MVGRVQGRPSTFTGDPDHRRKTVRAAIRAALGTVGPLRLAVAYVTGSPEKLLGVRLAGRDVRIVCDAWSGACDPYVLRDLSRRDNVTLLDLSGLHAKVMISTRALVVGSANLSTAAVRQGNVEAVGVVRDAKAVRDAVRWFDRLVRAAVPLAPVLNRKVDFDAMVAQWRARPTAARREKLSLLEAIEADAPELTDYVFIYYHILPRLTAARRVREEARRLGRELPPTKKWERFEEPLTRAGRADSRRLFEHGGKKLISFEVTWDEERILRFKRLDSWTGEFVSAFPVRDALVSNFLPVTRSPLRLGGPDARTLCQRLTEGVSVHPRFAANLAKRPYWYMTAREIQRLLRTS